jgi:hypothetical protein
MAKKIIYNIIYNIYNGLTASTNKLFNTNEREGSISIHCFRCKEVKEYI